MNHTKQHIRLCLVSILILAGCSNLQRTHRGDLLDDKVTEQRVQSEFARAGDDFKDIQVQTTNEVVVLSGTVKSSEIRDRAKQIVRDTHRAAKVEDNLQISGAPTAK